MEMLLGLLTIDTLLSPLPACLPPLCLLSPDEKSAAVYLIKPIN